jgi:hypothetical protein
VEELLAAPPPSHSPRTDDCQLDRNIESMQEI